MNTVPIVKGSSEQVTKHFNANELRCRSANAPTVYYLPRVLLDALEYLRSVTGVPIRITSAGRTKEHNGKTKGSATNSQHVIDEHGIARAIDFQFTRNNQDLILWLRDAVADNAPLWQELRRIGVRGIGFYDTFIHIDYRKTQGLQQDLYGSFALWNYQVDLKKKVSRNYALRELSSKV